MMNHPGVPTRWLSAFVLCVAIFTTHSAPAQLNLNVNRLTGATSISNPTASPIAIDGYTILSSFGALKPANGQWNSLDDQNVGGVDAWLESAPTTTELSELNPLSSTTLAALGGSLNLGTPYTHVFPALGVNPEHLTFEYNVFSGSGTTQGNVVYSGGSKIENQVILQINANTGQAQLKNDSPYDVFIDGYAARSPSGSLQEQNGKWFSLDDRNLADWEEALPTPFVVTELKQSGSMRLTAGSGYTLGELYNLNSAALDVEFEFLQPGNFTPTLGKVIYGAFTNASAPTPGVRGDFNSDGVVDGRDYITWREALGTFTVLRNDPVGGVVGTGQFNVWKSNFGSSTAGGAGTVLAAVPEPNSVLLLASVLAIFAPLGANFRGRNRTEA